MEIGRGDHVAPQRASKKSQASKATHNELSRVDPLTGQRVASTETEAYKRCERILKDLMAQSAARHFLDTSARHPAFAAAGSLDLSTVRKRLAQGFYLEVSLFVADVRKVWEGVDKTGDEVYRAAVAMSERFETLLSEATAQAPKAAAKKRTETVRASAEKKGRLRPMTIQEKSILRQNIMHLPPNKMQGLIEIIQPVVDTSKSKESLEFDIDKLPVEICRELETYVNKHQAPKQLTKAPVQEHIVALPVIASKVLRQGETWRKLKSPRPPDKEKGVWDGDTRRDQRRRRET